MPTTRTAIAIPSASATKAAWSPADTRKETQKAAVRKLLEELHTQSPKALIMGHNVFNPMKTCPCFDAAKEYSDLQPK